MSAIASGVKTSGALVWRQSKHWPRAVTVAAVHNVGMLVELTLLRNPKIESHVDLQAVGKSSMFPVMSGFPARGSKGKPSADTSYEFFFLLAGFMTRTRPTASSQD